MFSFSRSFINSFKNLKINTIAINKIEANNILNSSISQTNYPLTNSIRSTSFFVKLNADQLWKGCTSVSNAGRKRGRAKTVSKKNIRDLNRGQVIGVGKVNMLWPGLNAPIVKGRELIQQQKLPEDKEREAKLNSIRDQMGHFRSFRVDPIDRGWSGSRLPGRSVGPPDPIGEYTFDDFDTRVLEMKMVFVMKGNLGRKRRQSLFVITGNKKGLAGFAYGKSIEVKSALRKAKNRAAQKLMHFELCNGNTIFHDFFTHFGYTKIYVSKRPEGHGLVCHRAIKTICEVIGIKDLYAKIEGSTNVQYITKAFILGLLKQKTHAEIADSKGLHVVQFRKNNNYFPKVVASPSICRKTEDIEKNEIMDFEQYSLDGRVMLKRKKKLPFYTKLPSYEKHLKHQEHLHNKDKVRLDMLVQYGELRSFLADKYPESRQYKFKATKEED